MTTAPSDNNDNNESSPCIRKCCLDENDVCVGCFRSLSEILAWREKSENEKKVILDRCSKRKNKLL